MAELTPVSPDRAQAELAAASGAAGGDEWANDGKTYLLIEHTNGAGSTVTLTITTSATVDEEAVADKEISIPAGERHIIGPFPTNIYNDGDGHANISYDDETDIEVAVIQT